MTDLKRKVSAIFNFAFPIGSYLVPIKKLEVDGRLGTKQVYELLALILDELEALNETCEKIE